MEDAFARPTRSREEDEEALRWAAIQRLPTYRRLRTSILTIVHKEVDVRKLDDNLLRQEFIERNFKVTVEDNERFLRKLRDRVDK